LAHLAAHGRREFAIRLAIGSSSVRLLVDMGQRPLRTVAAGALLGAIAAFVALPLLDRMWLTNVSIRMHHSALALAIIFMVAVTAACYPASLALRADPGSLLRNQ